MQSFLSSWWVFVVILFYNNSPYNANKLIHKQLKIHECIFITVTTDTMVLKHQAISIDCAENISIVSNQFHTKILLL